MSDSKASAKRILAAERRIAALELRKAGRTYAAIGMALGVSEPRAHRLVTKELARLNEKRAEAGAEVTRLEMERLDQLWAAVWDAAKGGDHHAIEKALAIMSRRAKMLGL